MSIMIMLMLMMMISVTSLNRYTAIIVLHFRIILLYRHATP